ncbi:hypothetical protein [Streptomyces sp. NRRL F-5755]|uniref:hypothetical protein n=1 Tax=Streptomyces sp. NRRL F-5755 TaxID=1519475 RepID=UPI00133180D5|nr:hypothetical protein [Streptomyces sp. NRRL F-5755]
MPEWFRLDRAAGQQHVLYVAAEKGILRQQLTGRPAEYGIPVLVVRGFGSRPYADVVRRRTALAPACCSRTSGCARTVCRRPKASATTRGGRPSPAATASIPPARCDGRSRPSNRTNYSAWSSPQSALSSS